MAYPDQTAFETTLMKGSVKVTSQHFPELPAFLQRCAEKEPDMYVALYADEAVPYREIVRVLNIANENHFKRCV